MKIKQLFAIGGVTFATVFASCYSAPTQTSFQGPETDGVKECRASATFDVSNEACHDCIHTKCVAAFQTAQMTCGQDFGQSCADKCGTNTACYCHCAVTLPNGCGETLANAYACEANECASECPQLPENTGGSAGSSVGGSAGSSIGGSGGSGGSSIGGSGGSGGSSIGGSGGSGGSSIGGSGGSGPPQCPGCTITLNSSICDKCIADRCCSRCTDVSSSQQALTVRDCFDHCDTPKCMNDCLASNPEGNQLVRNLDACEKRFCEDVCTNGGCGVDAQETSCNVCLHVRCDDVCAVATNSGDFLDYLTCASQCTDDACLKQCDMEYPLGSDILHQVTDCLDMYCQGECGAS